MELCLIVILDVVECLVFVLLWIGVDMFRMGRFLKCFVFIYWYSCMYFEFEWFYCYCSGIVFFVMFFWFWNDGKEYGFFVVLNSILLVLISFEVKMIWNVFYVSFYGGVDFKGEILINGLVRGGKCVKSVWEKSFWIFVRNRLIFIVIMKLEWSSCLFWF